MFKDNFNLLTVQIAQKKFKGAKQSGQETS